MKKIFTLCFAALTLGTTSVWAQNGVNSTFQFVDATGKTIENGSIVTVSKAEPDAFGSLQMSTGLFIKNTTSVAAASTMSIDLTNMPSGTSYQCCAFGNCLYYSTSTMSTSAKGILKANTVNDIQTEWYPTTGKYQSWSATLQLRVLDISTNTLGEQVAGNNIIGEGPKVTVSFVYSDPTDINGVNTNGQVSIVTRYSANGQRLSAPAKGLNILKLSNGQTIKQILK
jgi:hypothetical protein